MGDSYTEKAKVSNDIIRSVFAFLDRPAYWLLGIVYQLFFNVASADLFSNDTIMKFYGRVQVILGVFMMFQLAMTILRGIIEPDSFSKEKGGGSLIRRVVIALILITVMMPINIPNPRNEYENQLNNNGLLFGTLYSLQHRILSNNTLGRLVLGTNDSNATFISDPDDTELKKSARIFTSTILKGFYRINLVPEDQRVDTGTKDPATANENRMCKNIPDDVLEAYTRVDAEPGEIISMVNETCTVDFNIFNYIPGVSAFAGSKKYVFTYMPFISMIVAIVFVFILLSFTIDVAVRAVKLAVLRLLAPIPIIAYMDPKGSGDETFKSWTKTLTSTYLDLFIRLAVVYFVIFLIQDMIVNGFVINHGTGIIGVLSLILIWIGLFIFAKQAPKFIKQVLGLKNDPGKLFGGLSDLVNTVGAAGATAAGVVGSARASYGASREADIQRGRYLATQAADRMNLTGAAREQYIRDHENDIVNRSGNRAKHIVASMAGGVAGGATGASAAWNAKDHQARAAYDSINKRNAKVLDAGRNGGTFFGALGSSVRKVATGQSEYDDLEAGWKREEQSIKDEELVLKSAQDANAHRKSSLDRAKSKAVDCDYTSGTYNGITGNYRQYHSAYEAALHHGTGVQTQYVDATTGTVYTKEQYDGLTAAQQAACQEHSYFTFNGQRIDMARANDIDQGLLDANAADFYNQVVTWETSGGTAGHNDAKISADRRAYQEATGDAMEATHADLKRIYGERDSENGATSDRLNRRRRDINEQRQGYQGTRAKSNDSRFGGGGGGHS